MTKLTARPASSCQANSRSSSTAEVDEDPLPGSDTDGSLQYRYEALRLLEHTGGRCFLVSDGWTPTYGVVFVLEADDDTIRLDVVRARR